MDSQPPAPVPPVQTNVPPSSNDRLLAAIGYPIWIVAVVALLMEGPKDRPFTRYHAVNALGLNVAVWIVLVVFAIVYCVVSSVSGILACVLWLGFLVPYAALFYYGYLAYSKAEYFEIPVVSDLMKQQGWLKKP